MSYRLAGLAVLFLLGVVAAGGLGVLGGAAQHVSPVDPPTTKRGAEIAALFHPPAFALDAATGLPRDNASASCEPGGGNYICAVSYGGSTTTAYVAVDGSVAYP